MIFHKLARGTVITVTSRELSISRSPSAPTGHQLARSRTSEDFPSDRADYGPRYRPSLSVRKVTSGERDHAWRELKKEMDVEGDRAGTLVTRSEAPRLTSHLCALALLQPLQRVGESKSCQRSTSARVSKVCDSR